MNAIAAHLYAFDVLLQLVNIHTGHLRPDNDAVDGDKMPPSDEEIAAYAKNYLPTTTNGHPALGECFMLEPDTFSLETLLYAFEHALDVPLVYEWAARRIVDMKLCLGKDVSQWTLLLEGVSSIDCVALVHAFEIDLIHLVCFGEIPSSLVYENIRSTRAKGATYGALLKMHRSIVSAEDRFGRFNSK